MPALCIGLQSYVHVVTLTDRPPLQWRGHEEGCGYLQRQVELSLLLIFILLIPLLILVGNNGTFRLPLKQIKLTLVEES